MVLRVDACEVLRVEPTWISKVQAIRAQARRGHGGVPLMGTLRNHHSERFGLGHQHQYHWVGYCGKVSSSLEKCKWENSNRISGSKQESPFSLGSHLAVGCGANYSCYFGRPFLVADLPKHLARYTSLSASCKPNVWSRMVWGVLIVRSLAEIIQHPLICLGTLDCAKFCANFFRIVVTKPFKKPSGTLLSFYLSRLDSPIESGLKQRITLFRGEDPPSTKHGPFFWRRGLQ